MTDGKDLIAQYRSAVEPSEAELDAVWGDVADPNARYRVVSRRRRPKPQPRGRLAIVGATLAVAAAAALAWWLGSLGAAQLHADGTPSQAPYEHTSTPREGLAGASAAERSPANAASERPPAPEASASPSEDSALTGAPAVGAATTPTVNAAPADPSPRGKGGRRGAASPSPSPSPVATPADDLARETKLIERAEALLRQGAPARALFVLTEHAKTFPAGTLRLERRALGVIARCQSGDRVKGRREAE